MRWLAFVGTLAVVAGCQSDPGPRVHSREELRALPPGPNDWSIEGIACEGFTRCTDGCATSCGCPPCDCVQGHLRCYPGIACRFFPDAASSDPSDSGRP